METTKSLTAHCDIFKEMDQQFTKSNQPFNLDCINADHLPPGAMRPDYDDAIQDYSDIRGV